MSRNRSEIAILQCCAAWVLFGGENRGGAEGLCEYWRWLAVGGSDGGEYVILPHESLLLKMAMAGCRTLLGVEAGRLFLWRGVRVNGLSTLFVEEIGSLRCCRPFDEVCRGVGYGDAYVTTVSRSDGAGFLRLDL